MSSIEKRIANGKTSWRAHYRTPEGQQRNKSFPRKIDAERFLSTVDNAKFAGAFVDPRRARVTVRDWCEQWIDAQAQLKPSSRSRYRSTLDAHVLPRWGDLQLAKVGHAAVQSWVSELGQHASPSAAVKAHRVLSLALGLAVRDGRLVRNPADMVRLPREVRRDHRYLTAEEVRRLADAAGNYDVLIYFLAYTGARFGEMAALRVRRLDLLRRRVEVAESVTAVNGHLVWGTPKGHLRRWISIPAVVVEMLAVQVAGKGPDDLVFQSPGGEALRASNFRRDAFYPACAYAGIAGLTPHGLRHTAASLAIAAGSDVKVVQEMLGHKTATMTLDLYGHLMPNRMDEVAQRLDVLARAALVANPLPQTNVVYLRTRKQTSKSP